MDVNNLTLPCHCKVLHNLDVGYAPSFPESVEEHYHILYFEALDLILIISYVFKTDSKSAESISQRS